MLGAALLVGSLALGQSAEPPKATEISFREFLEEITTSYPEFAILDAEIEGARALESLAFWTRWSPKVRARGVFGVVPAARGSIFDSPDTPRDLDDLGPFMRANVTASIPLFTFGRLSNAHEAASTLVQANEAKADAKKLAVTELAAKAYFGHLLADESLALIEEVQGRVGDLLDKLRSAEDDDDEEAESDPLDLLKTRSYELKLAQRHVEVERDRTIAASGMSVLAGFSNGSTVRPRAKRLKALAVTPANLELGLTTALTTRADLRALELGVLAKQLWAESERKKSLPMLAIQGRYGYGRADNREKQDNPFVYEPFNTQVLTAVIAVDWNLNFKQTGAKAAKSLAEAHELHAKRVALLAKTRHDVTAQHSRLRAAQSVHKSSKRAVSLSANWFRIAEESYELDSGSLDSVIDSYSNYVETRSAYFQAVHDLDLALIAWRLVQGLPPLEEGESP